MLYPKLVKAQTTDHRYPTINKYGSMFTSISNTEMDSTKTYDISETVLEDQPNKTAFTAEQDLVWFLAAGHQIREVKACELENALTGTAKVRTTGDLAYRFYKGKPVRSAIKMYQEYTPPALLELCDPTPNDTLALLNFNIVHGYQERFFNRPVIASGFINNSVLDPFGQNNGVLELNGTETVVLDMNLVNTGACIEMFAKYDGTGELWLFDIRGVEGSFNMVFYIGSSNQFVVFDRRTGVVSLYTSATNVFPLNTWNFIKIDLFEPLGVMNVRINNNLVLNVTTAYPSILYEIVRIGNLVNTQNASKRFFSNLRISKSPRTNNNIPTAPFGITPC